MNRYAYYYDFEHRNYYKEMSAFFNRNVIAKNRDILYLGSGSGYFPLYFLQRGARTVTCLDISPSFIKIFSGKLRSLGIGNKKIRLIRKDMSSFAFKERFDLVLVNGNSFSCLLSQEQQVSCLESIRRHLRPDGKAYIDISPLSKKLSETFSLKRSFVDAKGLVVVEKAHCALDVPSHRLDFHIAWSSKEGVFKDVVKTRIITLPEMHLLFKLTGLEVKKVFCDYSTRQRKDAYAWIFEIQR